MGMVGIGDIPGSESGSTGEVVRIGTRTFPLHAMVKFGGICNLTGATPLSRERIGLVRVPPRTTGWQGAAGWQAEMRVDAGDSAAIGGRMLGLNRPSRGGRGTSPPRW